MANHTRRAPIARFMEKIEVDANGCWLWTGGTSVKGYGSFSLGAAFDHKKIRAHRWSYEHFVGPVPEELELDHLCRVRGCVNPEHLEAVTHRENMLRSPVAPTAQNARKTHCKRGHPLSGENLVVFDSRNERICRECRRVIRSRYKRNLRARLRAAKAAASS